VVPAELRRGRERFQAIIAAIVGGQTQKYAAYFDVSEATVRNWVAGASVPSGHHRQQVFEKLHVPSDVLYYDDDKWHEYHKSLSSRIPPDLQIDQFSRLFVVSEQLLRIESTLASHTSVIILTSDADDVSFADVINVVKQNISRGIRYLYVIPHDCRGKSELARLALNSRVSGAGRGAMNVMVVRAGCQDIEWSLVDDVFFATGSHFVIDKETIANIGIEDIHWGFERLYKSSDALLPDYRPAVMHRGVWGYTSHRRANTFLNLVRAWSANVEWI
jgi:hypothetical protein